jgi:tetratricopeptide (TPR) repeat protein
MRYHLQTMSSLPLRVFIFGLLILGSFPLARGEEPRAVRWEASLPEGLKRAQSEKRLVMVDFWRDNCPHCVNMENRTFVDEQVVSLLGGFVAVRAKNTDHPAEIERYHVDGYPTLALLDAEGNAIDLFVGYLPPGEFVSWLSTAAEHYRRLSVLTERLKKDPADLEALLALGRLYSGDRKREEARQFFAKIIQADPEAKRPETIEAYLETGLTWRRGREHKKAVETLEKAREAALARLERATAARTQPAGPAGEGAGREPAAAQPEMQLLDRVLYELAASELLAGKREELVKTLEEYDGKVRFPDSRRHSWVLLQLGQERKKTGDRQAARRAFRRCDELYPRSTEARECREALSSLE